MESYFRNILALLALLALFFSGKGFERFLSGILLALLALSKIDNAKSAKVVPLVFSLNPLLLLDSVKNATNAILIL